MANLQCPKCGTLESVTAKQCAACGTSLAGVAPISFQAATSPAAETAQAPSAPSESSQPAAPTRPSATVPNPDAADWDADATAASAAAKALAAQAEQDQGRATAKRAARRHSAMEAVLPFMTGVVVSVLLQLFIANSVAPEAYVHRLFRPPGGWVMSLVPGLIVFVLVWTLMDLALKYRTALVNEADLDQREIRQLPRMVAQEPTGVTQRRLLQLEGRDRPVVRRLLWLLHYLESNDDAQRTHELLRHQSDLDADTAAASYRTVKLFIWAMPILGFVGTVLGISLAVGGFSNFLTTNLDIDDVSRVTSELGNVASGLSFAFDTTLLGLLAGLVANVFSSNVQKRDERFFTRLDELGLSIVANRAGVGPVPDHQAAGAGEGGAAFQEAMRARLHDLSTVIVRTQEVMDGLASTSTRMNSGLTESISAVRRTVEELGTNLEGVSEALAGTMSDLGEQVSASQAHFATGLTGLEDALQKTHQQSMTSAEAQASVERAVVQLAESIGEFGEMLAEFRTEQNALAPVLTQLAGPLELRLVPAPRGAVGALGAGPVGRDGGGRGVGGDRDDGGGGGGA